MSLGDQVPSVDRGYFPISRVVDVIPRMLFERDKYKISAFASSTDQISFTAVYLPHIQMYAYCAGLLYYEALEDAKDVRARYREEIAGRGTGYSVTREERGSSKVKTARRETEDGYLQPDSSDGDNSPVADDLFQESRTQSKILEHEDENDDSEKSTTNRGLQIAKNEIACKTHDFDYALESQMFSERSSRQTHKRTRKSKLDMGDTNGSKTVSVNIPYLLTNI